MVSLKAILTGVASSLGVTHALGPDWVSLGTEASQVSFDGDTLVVSNNGGGLLYSTKEFEGSPTWSYQHGNFNGVRVWGDKYWTVGMNNEVMYTSAPTPGNWNIVPGQLKSLAVDGKQLCGINLDYEIMCADDELTTNPHWRKLPGKFTQLDLTDGVIYAVGLQDSLIYRGFSHGEADWKPIVTATTIQQVSYDGGVLCAITGNNQLICATKGLPIEPQWMNYDDGGFTFVEVQAGRVYAVSQDTMIYVRYLTKRPEGMGVDWTPLQSGPKLRQINFDGKTLVGAASDMSAWIATDNFDASPNWFRIDGMLSHVVVWGDRLYGVGNDRQLWLGRASTDVQWQKSPGVYVQVSTDGKQLCAVNGNNEIWCADELIDTKPNWRRIDGGYQHVVVLNGVLMASRIGDDSVWVGRSQGPPKWRQMPGVNLRYFEYDGTNLCGTTRDGNVQLINSGFIDGNPNVQTLTGKAAYTAINGNRIFAVKEDYSIYSRANL